MDEITFKWITSDEIEKNKKRIILMYKDCFIKYHYPDIELSDSYFEKKIDDLENYLNENQAHVLFIYGNEKIIGFWWMYYSIFIDRKRCHINCGYIEKEYRNKGLSNKAHELINEKAIEDGCDEISTMYASFNNQMAKSLQRNGFKITRIECVKKIKQG